MSRIRGQDGASRREVPGSAELSSSTGTRLDPTSGLKTLGCTLLSDIDSQEATGVLAGRSQCGQSIYHRIGSQLGTGQRSGRDHM